MEPLFVHVSNVQWHKTVRKVVKIRLTFITCYLYVQNFEKFQLQYFQQQISFLQLLSVITCEFICCNLYFVYNLECSFLTSDQNGEVCHMMAMLASNIYLIISILLLIDAQCNRLTFSLSISLTSHPPSTSSLTLSIAPYCTALMILQFLVSSGLWYSGTTAGWRGYAESTLFNPLPSSCKKKMSLVFLS